MVSQSTLLGTLASRLAMSSLAPADRAVLERRVPGGLVGFAIDYRVLLAAGVCGLLVTLVFAMRSAGLLLGAEPGAGPFAEQPRD